MHTLTYTCKDKLDNPGEMAIIFFVKNFNKLRVLKDLGKAMKSLQGQGQAPSSCREEQSAHARVRTSLSGEERLARAATRRRHGHSAERSKWDRACAHMSPQAEVQVQIHRCRQQKVGSRAGEEAEELKF